jgi:hypothetical protein
MWNSTLKDVKRRTSSLRILLLLVVVIGAAGAYFLRPSVLLSRTPKCVFALAEEPAFLTEDTAVSKARETLDRAGLNANAWQPVASSLTTAPNGERDQFLARSSENPNVGHVIFKSGTKMRVVNIRLVGKRMTCFTYVPR